MYLHKRKFNTAILLFKVQMKKESLVNSLINSLGRTIASCQLRLGVNKPQWDLSLYSDDYACLLRSAFTTLITSVCSSTAI